MRRIVSVLMCLMLSMALISCGSQSDDDKSPAGDNVSGINDMVEDESADITTSFDIGWAGDDYVMYIPQPPFTEYYISYEEHQNLYIISDESDVELRAGYDALAAYSNTLKDAGFNNIEKDMISFDTFSTEISSIGASTLFKASNGEGYSVMIYQEEKLPMVWVYYPN